MSVSSSSFQAQQLFTSIDTTEDPVTGCLDQLHPLAFTDKANDPDTSNWYQATNSADAYEFWGEIGLKW